MSYKVANSVFNTFSPSEKKSSEAIKLKPFSLKIVIKYSSLTRSSTINDS